MAMCDSPWFPVGEPEDRCFGVNVGEYYMAPAFFSIQLDPGNKGLWVLALRGYGGGAYCKITAFEAKDDKEARLLAEPRILAYLRDEHDRISKAFTTARSKDDKTPTAWDRLNTEEGGLHTGEVRPKIFNFPPRSTIASIFDLFRRMDR